MRSVSFAFGRQDESPTEGKGIDWLLDSFLERKVTGQAGFDYEIIQTPIDKVVEVISEKYDYNNIKRILQSYTFYTLFLDMNIKIEDPNRWVLNWARFEFDIDGQNISILSFAPNVEGIKTTIEKNESRELNMALSAELGLPAVIPVDVKISPEIAYNKKNGWTVKFDTTIEEVKGFKTRTTNGTINLQWDIYKNKAIETPQSNIGETSGVYATALISTSKNSETIVKVKVSGETSGIGNTLRSKGIIEIDSRAKFKLEPTM